MSLSTLLFGIVLGLIILILIMFPESRKLLTGFTRLFIKDMATTPDGAKAIYEQKIDEAQKKYNIADDALRKAAGRLKMEENKLENLQDRLKKVEKTCESLVSKGDMASAAIKADERAEIVSDIERTKKLITAYSTAKEDAMEVHKVCEANLKKLRRDSKEVVENMRVKEQLNDVYDSMNDLKNTTATDKLLVSIKEKNEDLNASVAGARVVHDNKTSTKVQRVNEKAKKIENDEYLESLKKKYNKK